MRKKAYLCSRDLARWPTPEELEPYFVGPPEHRWYFEDGNDSVLLTGEGADGTEHLGNSYDRVDIMLKMWGDPDLGVLLVWTKWGGGHRQAYTSKGDLTRLHEYMLTLHDDPLPIGLFVSFEQAWRAVKEFLETDGALPRSIAWIAGQDLPPDTFPNQYEFRLRQEGRATS
jgi:hypothetical protein